VDEPAHARGESLEQRGAAAVRDDGVRPIERACERPVDRHTGKEGRDFGAIPREHRVDLSGADENARGPGRGDEAYAVTRS
jgi:hypothetical protein